jgi:molybdopterin-guanine dinucleotide biosynthesis protein A
VSAAAELIDRLASGQHPAVRAFLAEVGGQAVKFEDASRFANLNHASDLARLERLASDP